MISLVNADTRRIPLADKSVHMVATSVPYFGLRSYLPDNDPLKAAELGTEELHDCAAWARGERPCDDCYVCALRVVAAEIWRVLRDDGTFWLNLGDSYTAGGRGGHGGLAAHERWGEYSPPQGAGNAYPKRTVPPGLKPKDLVGIPWRVALALQADGWYLRSDVIWAKGISFCDSYSGSSMPESVTDRPSKSHEYVFLLAKRPRYFFDMEAVREKYSPNSLQRYNYEFKNDIPSSQATQNPSVGSGFISPNQSGRSIRSVWAINPSGYPGAHYAVWPEALVEPMIKAGTSEKGCCPACKAPWVRVTRKGEAEQAPRNPNPVLPYDAASGLNNGNNGSTLHMVRQTETAGWRPSCKCNAGQPVPCIVLDPFAGSGTTGVVARRHGRNFIGLDLSFAYLRDQAKTRLGLTALEAFENGAAVHDPNDYSDLFKVTP